MESASLLHAGAVVVAADSRFLAPLGMTKILSFRLRSDDKSARPLALALAL